jgi:hypothetical protein
LEENFGKAFVKELKEPKGAYNGTFWRCCTAIAIPSVPTILVEILARTTSEETQAVEREMEDNLYCLHMKHTEQPSFGKVFWDFECNNLVLTKVGYSLSETFMGDENYKGKVANDDLIALEKKKEEIIQDIRTKMLRINPEIVKFIIAGDTFYCKRVTRMLLRGWTAKMVYRGRPSRVYYLRGLRHDDGLEEVMAFSEEVWQNPQLTEDLSVKYDKAAFRGSVSDVFAHVMKKRE